MCQSINNNKYLKEEYYRNEFIKEYLNDYLYVKNYVLTLLMLEILYNHDDWGVRYVVSIQSNNPQNIIDVLLNDKDWIVSETLSQRIEYGLK